MPFPARPVLDAFTRADANPLDGNWLSADAWWGRGMALVSNQAVPAPGDSFGGAVWQTPYGPSMEASARVVGAAADFFEIDLSREPNTDGVLTGYSVLVDAVGSPSTVSLLRINGVDVNTTLGSDTVAGTLTGLGIARIGTAVEAYYRLDGVWVRVFAVTDATYVGPFYITIGGQDGGGGVLAFDDVGGGLIAQGAGALTSALLGRRRLVA